MPVEEGRKAGRGIPGGMSKTGDCMNYGWVSLTGEALRLAPPVGQRTY